MINYFTSNENTGLKPHQRYIDGSWICVDEPTADEFTALEKNHKIDHRALRDALDPTTVPRVERIDDLFYLFVRYPRGEPGNLSTEPILFVAGAKLFATISLHRVDVFDPIIKSASVDMTKNHAELALMLFDAIGVSYERSVESIGRKIEAIRSKLRGQIIEDDDFVNFVVIEGELNEFLTIMRSTSIMLKSLAHYKHKNSAYFGKYPDLIAQLLASNERSIANCELYEKSISGIRDAYSTLSSNRLNQTMKVLTVATLFVALPTSVFSMYGMNVSLPIQDKPWAFAVVLAISLLMPLAILVWAKRRKLL